MSWRSEISKQCYFLNLLAFQTCVAQLLQVWIPPPRTQSKTRCFERSIELEKRWFCSLYQSPDSPKFPKKFLSIIFLDIPTHLTLWPLTIGFISSIKVSKKRFLVGKKLKAFLPVLFIALEYWPSDITNNALYVVSSRYWNSQFTVTIGLVSSTLVSAENLKVLEL